MVAFAYITMLKDYIKERLRTSSSIANKDLIQAAEDSTTLQDLGCDLDVDTMRVVDATCDEFDMKPVLRRHVAELRTFGALRLFLEEKLQERVLDIIRGALNDVIAPSEDVMQHLTDTDRFVEDLGADSLDTVELVIYAEEEADIDITDKLADECKTVGDAKRIIMRCMLEQ